jgi:2-haloacid dehalogenase
MAAPAPRPSVVVFDLGGVLIDWNPRHLFRKIFDDPAKMEWFLGTVCTPSWHEQVDAGAWPEEIVPALQARYPEWTGEIAAFHERFEEMFGQPHAPMVHLLERLHAAGTPLYALTNWGADTFPWARRQYPFFARFRDIVVSGEEKVIKPDPRIFQILLRRGGFAPEAAVFVDDNAVNVEASRALGMAGVHHRDPVATAAALRAMGFPV